MERSHWLQLLPVWFEAGVYEWLAEAYRLPQSSGCPRTTGGKDIESLYLSRSWISQRWGTIGRQRQTRCPTWVGEKIRMLWLGQLSSLPHSCHRHMSFRFMHSMSFLSFCSIGLTLVEPPFPPPLSLPSGLVSIPSLYPWPQTSSLLEQSEEWRFSKMQPSYQSCSNGCLTFANFLLLAAKTKPQTKNPKRNCLWAFLRPLYLETRVLLKRK